MSKPVSSSISSVNQLTHQPIAGHPPVSLREVEATINQLSAQVHQVKGASGDENTPPKLKKVKTIKLCLSLLSKKPTPTSISEKKNDLNQLSELLNATKVAKESKILKKPKKEAEFEGLIKEIESKISEITDTLSPDDFIEISADDSNLPLLKLLVKPEFLGGSKVLGDAYEKMEDLDSINRLFEAQGASFRFVEDDDGELELDEGREGGFIDYANSDKSSQAVLKNLTEGRFVDLLDVLSTAAEDPSSNKVAICKIIESFESDVKDTIFLELAKNKTHLPIIKTLVDLKLLSPLKYILLAKEQGIKKAEKHLLKNFANQALLEAVSNAVPGDDSVQFLMESGANLAKAKSLIPPENKELKEKLEDVQGHYATLIQKQLRRKLARKKMRGDSPVEGSASIQKKTQVEIAKRFRVPLVDLEKQSDSSKFLTQADGTEAAHSKVLLKETKAVRYNKFLKALKATFESTLLEILSSPPESRKYVIIADDVGKSSNWVAAQVKDMTDKHPPEDIIHRENLEAYLKDHPDVAHVVMIDDGAYSGEQASRYVTSLPSIEQTIHVAIPFMTRHAKERISTAMDNKSLIGVFHESEIMQSYKDIVDSGALDIVPGKLDISTERLQNVKPMKGKGEEIDALNSSLSKLQKLQPDDEELESGVRNLFEQIENLGEKHSKERFRLTRSLKRAVSVAKDQRKGQALLEGYKRSPDFIGSAEASTTPTWMAHKSADGVSTKEEQMSLAYSNQRAVEPYKETVENDRENLVKELKNKMSFRSLDLLMHKNPSISWLKGRCDFVQSNRGFFLLSNTYYTSGADARLDMKITSASGEEKEDQFGGKTGAFMESIQLGDRITLTDPENGNQVTLELQNIGDSKNPEGILTIVED
jgi:hypothetical protein